MLLASWTFYTILKGFRSFNAENVGSIGQRAAKLPAWRSQNLPLQLLQLKCVKAVLSQVRLSPCSNYSQSFKNSNLVALSPTAPYYLYWKISIPSLTLFTMWGVDHQHLTLLLLDAGTLNCQNIPPKENYMKKIAISTGIRTWDHKNF